MRVNDLLLVASSALDMITVTLYRWTNNGGYLLRLVCGVLFGDHGALDRAYRWGIADGIAVGAGIPGSKRS